MPRENQPISARRGALWAAVVCCLLLPACARQNVPAEADVARRSLDAALASWKAGEQSADLARRTPPIVMGDFAWESGRKLADYRIPEAARNDGANLHYLVELTLSDSQGGSNKQEVSYVVGTDPTITIFRD
ncbi:MAG TPA: hypothetical protein VMV10_12200 [Pirellulales bacterium]|nr:hypothetical protein [Pirellulales bacterium]